MTDKQQKQYSGYDIDQTIEFTKDDLKNLRKPNRQPMDEDYFSRELNQVEIEADNELSDELVNEIEEETSIVDASEVEENPFRYKSKAAELRAAKEEEKRLAEQQAKEKREQFKQKFADPYEQIYDENEFDSIEEYNQFEIRNQEKSDKAPMLGSLLNRLKNKFTTRENILEDEELILENNRESNEETLNQNVENTTDNEEFLPFKESSEIIDENDEVDMEESNDEDEFDSIEEYNQFEMHNQEKSDKAPMFTSLLNQLKSKFRTHENDLEDENSIVESNQEDDEITVESMAEKKITIAADELHDDKEMKDLETEFEEIIQTDHHLDEMLVNEDLVLNESASQEEVSFVKGTAWLTAGNIISRVLGALYVIPWGTWFGTSFTTANVLYSIGYNPYALFLAISTGGFPSAIAKQMAYYHSKNEFKTADRIFKYSLLMMLVSGVVSAGLLFVLAPSIAMISSTDNPGAATIVIRSLAPALLILPIMSLLRGYFQGFGDMMPTAVSQILEQIARVIYMLAATYGIMKLWSGNVTSAVAHSTFAAFVGAFLSLIYLIYLYIRRLPSINLLKEQSIDETEIDFKESLVIVLKDSIPFILLGSGIIIAKFIDQITFKFILEKTSTILIGDISKLFGVLNLDVDKLIMIIISIAVGMSLSSIPLITSLYAKKEEEKVAHLIEKIIILFLVVMLPAAFGMASIANNMYEFFYPYGHAQGPSLLVTASYLSIILGAYTILSTIIQSMNYRRAAIKYLMIGLIVKIVLQFPLVAWLQAHGALIATLIAFLVASVLMMLKIHVLVGLHFREMLPDFIILLAATLLMAVSASFWNSTFDLLFGPVGRALTFVKILLVVIIAAFNYFSILGLFGKLSLLLGSKYQEFQDKVRMF